MLDELKTLLAVVRHGTFAAAGERIGLSQSAVSARIRQLEARLGTPLFERTGRALRLAPDGQRIVAMAEEMLALAERMKGGVTETPVCGHLRLGAIASVQCGLLPPVLRALRTRAPALTVQLVPGVSLELLDRVDRGELDLALMIRPPFALPESLRGEVFRREPFVLVTPAELDGDDPLTLLKTQPFIQYERGSFGGRQVAAFLERQRLSPAPVLEIDEIEALVRMVAVGLGVALVPLGGLWPERSDDVRMLSLGAHTFYRELMIVTQARYSSTVPVSLLTECLHAAPGPRENLPADFCAGIK
ncbi:LysR family transcriptional regulator [Phytohalomonas tamaricis]|uniref:LysR family transcriptional regulator n=1 Tax=Phytohalomonas tamaricis TaxID=2081032 RepID=UPI000D0B1F74|nr:LysR family transcriptional regulator [Phytohalomonas tamaricis]